MSGDQPHRLIVPLNQLWKTGRFFWWPRIAGSSVIDSGPRAWKERSKNLAISERAVPAAEDVQDVHRRNGLDGRRRFDQLHRRHGC